MFLVGVLHNFVFFNPTAKAREETSHRTAETSKEYYAPLSTGKKITLAHHITFL